VFVEPDPRHRVQVSLQRKEAVQGGPQAIALDGQDQLVDTTLVVPDQIDFRIFDAALNLGDVLRRRHPLRQRRILAGLALIVVRGLHGVAEFTAVQVHQAGLHTLELLLDAHPGFEQAGCCKDILLAVQGLIGGLQRAQHDRRGRHHHGTDQTQRQGDQ